MDMLRYSSELEREINLMSALIYARLEEDGYWKKRVFHINDLTREFKTGKQNMYRQLNYLVKHGYIEYEKPWENKAGKIKTLKIVNNDSSIDMDSLKNLPKFHPTRIKILTAISHIGEATTNQVWNYIETSSRSTVSRVMLELQKMSLISSYCKIPVEGQPNVMENIWRVN